ncbi:phage tail sheath subtilisin-like domain-containing protein [Winogradskya humida]|uniref:Tail protein n=1 Tax=Winogradskya humida TaxID=113566 RepID=A0ABQ3ZY95_9ACTN|nr:phage tail sheath subtilisin-like domain-containing protein [Actinoplanes humidus]GIE23625.1 tail protein [Actinoplanes humidus]
MALQVGLNVTEVDGRAAPAPAAANTSIAAFAGRTRRGVPGQAVRITGLDQFVDRFGGDHPDGFLPAAVSGFFLNGGREATVVRVIGAGSVAARATLNDRQGAPAATLRVTAGHRGVADPGVWAHALRLDVRDDPQAAGRFRLIIRLQDPSTGAFPVVETWPALSLEPGTRDYAPDRLNHPVTGSRFVTLAALGSAIPAVVSGVALAGGAEPAAAAGDLIAALRAFDTVSVQLLAIPDAHLLATAGEVQVARTAMDYAAARGDCMYVGSAPDRGHPATVVPRSAADYNQTVAAYTEAVKQYATQFQGAKVYGALYTPWILVADPAGVGAAPVRFVPPEGHVMGVYARTEQERGIHKAPAGDAATVRGALSLAASFGQGEHDDLVRTGRTNAILSPGGRAPAVAASRTLSTDPRWQYVGVRLLFNFVKSSLRDGLRFVRQEPHTDALRRMVKFNVVTPFLLGLRRTGAFGSDPADKVFTVKCDAENNPPANVDLGLFTVEVFFFPSRPAETVQIIVGQQPGGGTAAEA